MVAVYRAVSIGKVIRIVFGIYFQGKLIIAEKPKTGKSFGRRSLIGYFPFFVFDFNVLPVVRAVV